MLKLSSKRIKRNFLPMTFYWTLLIAVTLLSIPAIFSSSTELNLIAQVCIAAVLGLSFNILLGQTGLLSFGHAMYAGLGAFASVHVMNQIGLGEYVLPVSFIPLVGGLAGLMVGAICGWIASKKAGIVFSMISLGISELVFAMAPMFPQFFGGEAGISTNRVIGDASFSISFGPQIEVTYLIIVWTLMSMGAMFFLTLSPLGILATAVRDNPERVAFLGVNPRLVRFLMICFANFFAGVSGALSVLHFEIATTDSLSMYRSGSVLLFTYIGGISLFLGPVLGAILAVCMTVLLSELTPAWQLYLGLLFILVVSFAPKGISGVISRYLDSVKAAYQRENLVNLIGRSCLHLFVNVLIGLSLVILIELTYQMRFADQKLMVLDRLELTPFNLNHWLAPIGMLTLGVLIRMVAKKVLTCMR